MHACMHGHSTLLLTTPWHPAALLQLPVGSLSGHVLYHGPVMATVEQLAAAAKAGQVGWLHVLMRVPFP